MIPKDFKYKPDIIPTMELNRMLWRKKTFSSLNETSCNVKLTRVKSYMISFDDDFLLLLFMKQLPSEFLISLLWFIHVLF